MKLNKKILCVAAAAAMALSTVVAMAAPPTSGLSIYAGGPAGAGLGASIAVPVPVFTGDKAATFAQAENFYNNGLYFEAHIALSAMLATPMTPALTSGEIDFINACLGQIEDAIDRVLIDESFADVEAYMANGYYAEAADLLQNDVFNLAVGNATASTVSGAAYGNSEILYDPANFTMDDWYKAQSLKSQIMAGLGDSVSSTDDAIRIVEQSYYIPDGVWLEAVQVGTRYDVYAKTYMFGDVITVGSVDMTSNGQWTRVDMSAFTPKTVFENPIIK